MACRHPAVDRGGGPQRSVAGGDDREPFGRPRRGNREHPRPVNNALAAVVLLPHAAQELEGGSADIPILKGIERTNLASSLSGVESATRSGTARNSARSFPVSCRSS